MDLPEQTPYKQEIRPKVLKRGLAVDLPEQTPYKQKSGRKCYKRGLAVDLPEQILIFKYKQIYTTTGRGSGYAGS